MKKLIIFLLLLPVLAQAQKTYFVPGIPPASTSISPTFRTIAGDSLTTKIYLGIAENQFWQVPTWPQMRVAISASGYVPNTRQIINGYAITGGHALSTDVTLAVDTALITTHNYFNAHAVQLNANNTITGLNTVDTTFTINKQTSGQILVLNSGGLPAFNFTYSGGYNYFNIPNNGAIIFKNGYLANGNPFTLDADIDYVHLNNNAFVYGIPNATTNFVIGNALANDDPSAKLSVTSTTEGFLPPRMTTTQRNAISTPAAGLEIFNTTTSAYNYYDGAVWQAFGTGAGSGTVTSVTSADANATVATTTTTPVITIVSAPKWATARNLAGNSVDGSANVAFANKFIVQGTTDAGLTNAQFLGALATGIVKNTTATGVLSIAIAADFPILNQPTTSTAANLSGTPALPNGTTATTQSGSDNSTKIATTAQVQAAIGLIAAPPVSSVFGRTGAVVAAANDYTFAQIGTKPTTVSGYGIVDALTPTNTSPVSNKTMLPANIHQTPVGTPGTDSLTVKIGATGKLGAISANYYQIAGSYQPLEDQRLSTTNSPSFVKQILTGTAGGGYEEFPSQSASPGTSAGKIRLYSDSLNRFSWKNSTYRRTIQVPYPSDMTIRMPWISTQTTLVDSTQAKATYAALISGTGYPLYAGASVSFSATIPTTSLSGALQSAQFPALTGDITTVSGALATTLKNTGTAGTYGQVTTDAQGRVTSGAANANLSAGNGLIFSNYNGSGAVTAKADTGIIQTILNFHPLGNTFWVPLGRTVNGKALSSNITLLLASADFANQGTTTTVLHGNGAGNPSFGSVVNNDIAASTIDLTTKVTGLLPVANGGTGVNALGVLTFGSHLTSGGSSYNATGNVTITSDATATPSASVISTWDANSNMSANDFLSNATITVSSGGTLTLTASSSPVQIINGSTTHTVVLPVVNTIPINKQFTIINESTGVVTVQSSGANQIAPMPGGTSSVYRSILTTGTGTASWDFKINGVSTFSGTGAMVLASNTFLSNTTTIANTVSTTFTNGTAGGTNNFQTSTTTGTPTSTAVASYQIDGSTNLRYRVSFGGNNSTLAVGDSYSAVTVIQTPIQTNTSGTSALLTNFSVNSLSTVTKGTGSTITDIYNAYIGPAATTSGSGTLTNAAGSLWVNGPIRLDLGSDATGDIFYRGAANGGQLLRLAVGTATQMLGGGTTPAWVTGSITQASADLTGQTAAGNVTTFTVGASTATFNISTYINVTAVSVDVIQGQITYTDENNTGQTVSLANISAIGNSTYNPVTIRAKNGTVITVKTNLTTGAGSITFDTGARISQL